MTTKTITQLEQELAKARKAERDQEAAAVAALVERRRAWGESVLATWPTDQKIAFADLDSARKAFDDAPGVDAWLAWAEIFERFRAARQRAATAASGAGQLEPSQVYDTYAPPPFAQAMERALAGLQQRMRRTLQEANNAETAAIDAGDEPPAAA